MNGITTKTNGDSRKADKVLGAAEDDANTTIQDQIRDLRLDIRRVHPEGIVGNMLFWWLWPIKFVADPIFAAAETVAPVIDKVPLVGTVASTGCQVVQWTAHTAYGVLASEKMGHLLSSDAADSCPKMMNYKALSHYLGLMYQASSDDAFRYNMLRKVHETAGRAVFLVGANQSMSSSLIAHPQETLTMVWEAYGALHNYADILEEATEMGGLRYAQNKALLARTQQADLDNSIGKHRVFEMLMENQKNSMAAVLKRFPMSDLRYYIKFAVAAYGDNGIKSSMVDASPAFDWRNGNWTPAVVSEHTGIPEADLRMMDDSYHSGDTKQLRHFVAIDRINRKIILAIRGTYTHKGVMNDFSGCSCELFGGEAHADLTIMSKRLWAKIGTEVVDLLNRHDGYELIVTGHSLGGGSTCLLNLMLHRDDRMRGCFWRAIAYGSPPVYVPYNDEVIPVETRTCVNVINQYDNIPFMSADSVRHQMVMISAIDEAYSGCDMVDKAKLLLGFDKPDPALVNRIHHIQREPLPVTKPGVPRGMSIPAIGNVWIWPKDDIDVDAAPYKAVVASSNKMSTTGIFIHKNDFTDHLPARYEYVLNHTT